MPRRVIAHDGHYAWPFLTAAATLAHSAGDFASDAEAALQGERYTGSPTIVGTGEATPLRSGEVTPQQVNFAEQVPPEEVRPPEDLPVSEPAPAVDTEAAGLTARSQDTVAPASTDPVTEGPPPTEREALAGSMTAAGQGPREGGESDVARAPDGRDRRRDGSEKSPKRYRLPGLAALFVLIAAAVAVVIVVSSGGSSKPSGQPSAGSQQSLSTAQPVPTNHVTGSGAATVVLRGDTATLTLDTNGLLDGSPHAMHIHAGGLGVCPPASAARLHNGHLAIDTKDGLHWYGPPQVSLTTSGDTSAATLQHSVLAFSRYPDVGDIRYTRTITVPPGVAAAIRANDALVVVHGINYDASGIYDDVLGQSDLNPGIPSTATAPALCGQLVGSGSASTNRQGRSSTVFVATLRRPVFATVAQAISFSLVCHLLGVPMPGQVTDPQATFRAS